ncbi:hypothetical protein CDL12_23039 [Handroanthus impetiginosus]|uniref:Uncharacterized protein n=1 Tax=Handroanthus impetiginosus TaxID=429701 RepID=A0A2G9GGM6_9LAMI|nr:hypothetical protein CDL12_23039 [Handroanthus impetiginosus]
MQLRRLPRHPLRPLSPTILPRMRHLRNNRFHFRKRRRRLPIQQSLRPPTKRKPTKHFHRPRTRRSKSEHRNFHPKLQSRRRHGFNSCFVPV